MVYIVITIKFKTILILSFFFNYLFYYIFDFCLMN